MKNEERKTKKEKGRDCFGPSCALRLSPVALRPTPYSPLPAPPRVWSNRLTVAALVVAVVDFGVVGQGPWAGWNLRKDPGIGDGGIPRVKVFRAGDGPLVVKDWLELFASLRLFQPPPA